MAKTNYLSVIFLFILIACALNFFEPQAIANTSIKYFRIPVIALGILISIPYLFSENRGGFILPVKLIAVSTVVSLFTAYISWNQPLMASLKSTIPLMIWFVFFYFRKHKIQIEIVEKVIMFYGVIYIILFLFQFTHTDTVYFGWQEEFKEDRGIIRVNFPGMGVLFLSSFIALVKASDKSTKGKFWWRTYALISVVVNVLQVTRQSIVLMLIVYAFHLLRGVSVFKKALVLSFFAISVVLFFAIENPIAKGLMETQKEDSSMGEKYIRVVSGTFFLSEFSPDNLSKALGNGVPYYRENDASDYGKYEYFLQQYFDYYLSDVGLIGFYVMFGTIAVIAYFIIFIKSFTIPLPSKYYYLKYYIWYLIATCLTSDSVYSVKTLVINVIVLVCYQSIYESQKQEVVDNPIVLQLS